MRQLDSGKEANPMKETTDALAPENRGQGDP